MFVLVLLVFSLIACASAQTPDPAWTTTQGLQEPESAYFHAGTNTIYVSNIAGGATEKDGNGWISKIRPDGTMIEKKWIDGLNAPKGLRTDGNILWVSDIDRLVGFRLKDGKKVKDASIEKAKFLNDVAVGYGGTVYVSAMRTNKIYRYHNDSLSVFAEGSRLESPNGLLVSGRRLLVGGWSAGQGQKGNLFSIDLKTKEKTVLSQKQNTNMDGLELNGRGNYLISDWKAGVVYRFNPSGKRTPLVKLKKSTADIGFIPGQHLLLVPHMNSGKLLAYRIGPDHEYQNLIDQNLSHWQTEGNWSVNDQNQIVLKPGPEDEGWKRFEDYLTSKKQYGNFELHVEYRIPEDGNSGVFFRIKNPSKPVSTGIEAQVLDSFDNKEKLGPHDNGGIIDTAGPSKNMSRPPGTWNHMIVIARDHQLRIILNGEQVQNLNLKNTPVSDRPKKGHISLQDHGLPFHLRSVRIRELK